MLYLLILTLFCHSRLQRNCYYKECFVASNEKVAANKNDVCGTASNSEVIIGKTLQSALLIDISL